MRTPSFKPKNGMIKGIATLIEDSKGQFIIVAPNHETLHCIAVARLGIKCHVDTRKFKEIAMTEVI